MGRTRERNLHFLATVCIFWTSTLLAAGVDIRLHGTIRCSGRLEIKQGQLWRSVCVDGWDLPTAQVVCRELGCATALRAFNVSGRANETVRIELSCPEKEKPLGECERLDTKKCGHSEDAAVECSEPLLPLISLATAGVLLLLLLLSVAICQVCRKRRAKGRVPTRFVSRENNEYQSDKEEEDDDYVNVINPVDSVKKQRGAAKVEDGDDYEELDSAEDHSYEEATPRPGFAQARPVRFQAERSEQEESSSDDEGDYENVSQPLAETEVCIYWKQEDIYENL
ncbi:scavenger receptor cysteine-rich type 1 protein M130-like [Nelusetta ayraudi]|uniref:scavenger receptor cysteine-rich type 1 protein M130-like n=1 Tax=Nelusetta ayraudi TaxID=303726 RepID=UPI003F72A022